MAFYENLHALYVFYASMSIPYKMFSNLTSVLNYNLIIDSN